MSLLSHCFLVLLCVLGNGFQEGLLRHLGGGEAVQPVVLCMLILEEGNYVFSILKICQGSQKLRVELKQQAPTFTYLYINHIKICVREHVHKTMQGIYESERC